MRTGRLESSGRWPEQALQGAPHARPLGDQEHPRARLHRPADDNEAVTKFPADEAGDLEWMVHRAGICSDGASKGALKRSATPFGIATFVDCAAYNVRAVQEREAVRSCEFSRYAGA